ncbi:MULTISPECIES: hypothetical protein [Streptomyces]|uniref:Uncharacterized protein n=2 Tax=Streptomyces TaxID=1883 RepID=A0ABW6E4D7_9ACTN|nr:hypothetical protein [Streptomyces nanshensis]
MPQTDDMDIAASSALSTPDLAAYLMRTAPTQELQPPVTLGIRPAPPLAQSGAERLRQAIDAVSESLGPPTLYGGSAVGPTIRWRTPSHTVILDSPDVAEDRLQLSVRRTEALELSEADRFRHATGLDTADLPFLWQWQPIPTAPPPPSVPVAHDWMSLRASLEALLRAWCEQLEAQLGQDDAGFDIVIDAEGKPRRLVVLVSPADSLTVLVDDRDGADSDDHHAEMTGRGWQDLIPLHRWWGAYFERTSAGAAAAAELIGTELRARGAQNPHDLRLADVGAGEGHGLLALPALGIAPALPH